MQGHISYVMSDKWKSSHQHDIEIFFSIFIAYMLDEPLAALIDSSAMLGCNVHCVPESKLPGITDDGVVAQCLDNKRT